MVRATLTLALALTLTARAASESGPLATLREDNDAIDRVLRRDGAGQDAELRAVADRLLDYEELARLALADEWRRLDGAQRREFVATLRELMERSYVGQLRTQLDYRVVYGGELVQGARATVTSVVHVRTRGRATDVSVDYALRRSGGRWRVYDVVTDGVSMMRNYRAEFHRVMAREGYPGLLRKMRARIAAGPSASR